MKTTVSIVNNKDVTVNMIDAYNKYGFYLMDKSFLLGPAIILPDKVFHWNIDGDKDVHPKSLEFFFHLHPPLDLLIIGLGDISVKRKIEADVFSSCRKHNLQVEILSTPKAVSTYNFLAEMRKVGGAFIPPFDVVLDDTDLYYHRTRFQIDELRDTGPDKDPAIYPQDPVEKKK